MALMQINVIPLGTGSASVGEFVAGITKALAREGVVYKLTDMGTVVEGEAGELLQIAARIHELPFLKGAKRVVTQISIDDRRDKIVSIGDKVSSVNRRLNVADGTAEENQTQK
ncbi:MAG: MTH1187 family thiamine-binding protein [Desulfobulbaceae bacterium]|nr:MTH1187 family thiamine-binding protein [Desulfobulbaceae bacterium]